MTLGPRIWPGNTGLRDLIAETLVSKTIATRFDLWIDYDNGNDSNDGLTEATAVKTVKRLGALIPDLIAVNYFVINVRGAPLVLTPDNNAVLWFHTMICSDSTIPIILLVGENEKAIHLDDGAGGNIVSDIHADGYVGLTTATWIENEHRGYWCQIKTGPLAGEFFVVDHNNDTTLYLMNCPSDPGSGAEFVIYKPKTEISAGPFWLGENQDLQIVLDGPGQLYMNYLHFTGGATFAMENAKVLRTSVVNVGNCIVKADGTFYGFLFTAGGNITCGTTVWDVSTAVPTNSYSFAGVSFSGYPPIGAIWAGCIAYVECYACLIPELMLLQSDCPIAWYLSSVHATRMMSSNCLGHGGSAFGCYGPGWLNTPTRFGGHRAFGIPVPDLPAIEMLDSAADFQKSKIVDSTMALRMVFSKAIIQEAEGDDHTVCGVHADAHSFIGLIPGTVPTLAGNGGTVELSKDGSTEISKWSAIAATPISDPEVICKEYDLSWTGSFPV